MKTKFGFIIGGSILAGLAVGALAIFLIFGNKMQNNEEKIATRDELGMENANTSQDTSAISSSEDSVNNESEGSDSKEDKNTDESESAKKDDSAIGKTENDGANGEEKNQDTKPTDNNVVLKENGTPVGNHGKLRLDGTQVVDAKGEPYQIKGVSTHGLAWFPAYVNQDAFKTIRDSWGANCIRLAMYSAEYNGYCTGGNKEDLKNIVKRGVQYATDLDMYVIIDWHVLGDQNPNTYKSEAIDFFSQMSKEYANYNNVIYEICNEPNGGTTWEQVKAYAEEVIPVIKGNDPEALIIVGTPTWSQDVDKAAANPITGYSNIMYALHFYADTHKDDLRNKMNNAIKAGLPIFVSEFGVCDASGSGANNYSEGEKWINLLNDNKQSYCIWNLSNKNETSSLIAASCSKNGGWSESDLSDSGKWYVKVLGGSGNASSGNEASNEGKQDNGSSNNEKDSNGSSDSKPGVSTNNGSANVSVANTGGWNDGKSDFTQFTITIKAEGGTVNGWKLVLDFGKEISIDQSWSGSFAVSGNTITVSPVDYNKTISNGGSCELGVIVKSSGSVGNPTISISAE